MTEAPALVHALYMNQATDALLSTLLNTEAAAFEAAALSLAHDAGSAECRKAQQDSRRFLAQAALLRSVIGGAL